MRQLIESCLEVAYRKTKLQQNLRNTLILQSSDGYKYNYLRLWLRKYVRDGGRERVNE